MFRTIYRTDAMEYGPSYGEPRGGIATPGTSTFRHRFGGNDWRVDDQCAVEVDPSLLLTFDLTDPILTELFSPAMKELPLCSYLGCDMGASSQFYHIDATSRRVTFIQRGEITEIDRSRESCLPPKRLVVNPMVPGDYPVSEEMYWRTSEQFLGGSRFIRVLGPPLWSYCVEDAYCRCGRKMRYVAALGYESAPPHSFLLDDRPVFFGEMAIYWMLCSTCFTVAVLTQST